VLTFHSLLLLVMPNNVWLYKEWNISTNRLATKSRTLLLRKTFKRNIFPPGETENLIGQFFFKPSAYNLFFSRLHFGNLKNVVIQSNLQQASCYSRPHVTVGLMLHSGPMLQSGLMLQQASCYSSPHVAVGLM
jgi:hypothetical protein